MKKLLVLLAICSLWSCKKQNEITQSQNGTDKRKTFSAADGLFDVLGYGYNVTGEYGNSSAATYKIIDVARLKAEAPNRVETDLSKKQDNQLITSENVESYSRKVSANLKATTGFLFFKGSVSASYSDASAFSSKYVYGSYNLVIQEKRVKFNSTIDLLKNYITPEFTADIQNNSAEYIVRKYGTHVLSDIILGAKLEVLYQAQTSKSDRTVAAAAGMDVGIGKLFSINTGLGYDQASTSGNSSQKLHYRTYGGDPSISLMPTTVSLDQNTPPKVSVANWQSSSKVENAELIDISPDGLIAIYELISDPGKKAAVHQYVDQYLSDNKVKASADPIYQFYNGKNGGNHYASPDINATNGNTGGWGLMGVDFKAFTSQVEGTVPVYLFYNNPSFDHFVTADRSSVNGFNDWQFYGTIFYAYPTQVPGTVPIYVYYNAGGKNHYTTSEPNITSQFPGWTKFGVSFYAFPR